MVWIALLVVHLLIALPVTAATALDESPALHSAIGEYDMFQRPDPEGVPTEVSIGPYVIDIADISDVDRHVTVDFSLLMRWRDTRLAVGSEEGGASLRRFKLTDVWNPHVLFLNQRRLFKEGEDTVTVDPEGRVRYEQRYVGNISFDLDLRDFPFDSHTVSIGLVSGTYGPDEVAFVIDPTETGRAEYFSIVDYDIGPGRTQVGTYYFAPRHQDYSALYYTFRAERYSAFYVWKVIVPLVLIVAMSWMVFWIDPSQMGPQIGISTASVFTLIMFQFNLGRLVPRVPYIMRIDILSFGAIVLVFMALLEAMMSTAAVRLGRESLGRKMDLWSRFVFPAVFALVCVYALLLYGNTG
jgi:hypothetical protein